VQTQQRVWLRFVSDTSDLPYWHFENTSSAEYEFNVEALRGNVEMIASYQIPPEFNGGICPLKPIFAVRLTCSSGACINKKNCRQSIEGQYAGPYYPKVEDQPMRTKESSETSIDLAVRDQASAQKLKALLDQAILLAQQYPLPAPPATAVAAR
jgi:hypothetical protein